jgi:T5orf172 domain
MPLSIVYVLSNPAMPGLVKIGKTYNDNAELRLAQLYTTGVPFPFQVEFACRVENCDEVERALHTAFAPNRINPRREFFQIDAAQAIAILKLLHVSDDTEEFQTPAPGVDQSEINAGEQFRQRRPNLNFQEMGIPIGAELVSTVDGQSASVVGPRHVEFRGQRTSLTAATREILRLDYSVAPGPYWSFQGKLIKDIYNDTYPSEE